MVADPESCRLMGERALARIKQWPFEEDVAALRAALNYLTGLPLQPHERRAIVINGNLRWPCIDLAKAYPNAVYA